MTRVLRTWRRWQCAQSTSCRSTASLFWSDCLRFDSTSASHPIGTISFQRVGRANRSSRFHFTIEHACVFFYADGISHCAVRQHDVLGLNHVVSYNLEGRPTQVRRPRCDLEFILSNIYTCAQHSVSGRVGLRSRLQTICLHSVLDGVAKLDPHRRRHGHCLLSIQSLDHGRHQNQSQVNFPSRQEARPATMETCTRRQMVLPQTSPVCIAIRQSPAFPVTARRKHMRTLHLA